MEFAVSFPATSCINILKRPSNIICALIWKMFDYLYEIITVNIHKLHLKIIVVDKQKIKEEK